MHELTPELIARSLVASVPFRGGRAVPALDPKNAPPERRPAYPRVIKLTAGKAHPRDQYASTPLMRAAAARLRARVARVELERREARMQARHASARIGGEA